MTFDDRPHPAEVGDDFDRTFDRGANHALREAVGICTTCKRPPGRVIEDRRVPPNNTDAEASILGAVLLDNAALGRCSLLRPEHFYDPRHRHVFEAMLDCRARSVPIDTITLEDALVRAGKLEAIGGLSFLTTLVSVVPTADNVRYYADIVEKQARARRIIVAASEIAAKGFSFLGEVEEYAAEALREIRRAAGTAAAGEKSRLLGAIAEEVVKVFDERHYVACGGGTDSDITDVMPTGLRSLDGLLGGGWPVGLLSVLGGWPSHGKSALARQSAIATAWSGRGVHVFSAEDRSLIYGQRVVAQLGNVPLTVVRTALEVDRDVEMPAARGTAMRVHGGAQDAAQLKIRVDERTLTVEQIEMEVENNLDELGTGLVVVDYVDAIAASPHLRRAQDVERRNWIYDALARLAKNSKVAVLALSQLRKPDEPRPPRKSDLKYAGDAQARVIVFPWQPEVEKLRGSPEILVEKHSHGRLGRVPVKFDGATTRFVDLDDLGSLS